MRRHALTATVITAALAVPAGQGGLVRLGRLSCVPDAVRPSGPLTV